MAASTPSGGVPFRPPTLRPSVDHVWAGVVRANQEALTPERRLGALGWIQRKFTPAAQLNATQTHPVLFSIHEWSRATGEGSATFKIGARDVSEVSCSSAQLADGTVTVAFSTGSKVYSGVLDDECARFTGTCGSNITLDLVRIRWTALLQPQNVWKGSVTHGNGDEVAAELVAGSWNGDTGIGVGNLKCGADTQSVGLLIRNGRLTVEASDGLVLEGVFNGPTSVTGTVWKSDLPPSRRGERGSFIFEMTDKLADAADLGPPDLAVVPTPSATPASSSAFPDVNPAQPAPTASYVVPFEAAAAQGLTVTDLGGKGLRLTELTAAGVHVPLGSVVVSQAYAMHMESVDLEAILDSDDDLSAKLACVCSAIDSAPLSPVIVDQLAAFLDSVPPEAEGQVSGFAVRSSGISEDGAASSYAGQFQTILNVHGLEDITAALLECWCSLWHPDTFAYEDVSSLSSADADDLRARRRMAVVIQRQLHPTSAGVMFTLNPMNGHLHEMVVEGVWGLGELLVSAVATPARVVYNWADKVEVDRVTGAQTVKLVRSANKGTVEEQVTEEELAGSPIAPETVRKLCEIGLRVACHYGHPQDMEWAVTCDGQIHILQTRPITSFACPLEGDGQYYPVVYDDLVPLTQTLIGYSHGRFYNICGVMMGLWDDDRTDVCIRSFFTHMYTRYGVIEYLRKEGLYDKLEDWVLTECDRYNAELLERLAPLRPLAHRISTLSDAELHDYISPALQAFDDIGTGSWIVSYFAEEYMNDFVKVVGKIQAAAEKKGIDGVPDVTPLLAGLPTHTGRALGDMDNIVYDAVHEEDSAEIHEAVRNVPPAEVVSALEAVGGEGPTMVAAALKEYVDKYFWMSDDDMRTNEGTHWGDHPEIPYAQFQARFDAAMATMDAQSAKDHEQAAAAERSTAEAAMNAALDALGKDKYRENYERAIDRVRRFYYAKEAVHVHTSMGAVLAHHAFAELGRRWYAAAPNEPLSCPEDIWRCGLQTYLAMWRGHDFRTGPPAVLANELVQGKMFAKLERPSWLYNASSVNEGGDDDEGDEDNTDRIVSGKGVASGRARGTARICPTLDSTSSIEPGDILITKRTTPGWTPLFASLGGVVVEDGGLLSHTAIVARERGIPVCVIAGAMKIFKEGETIVVNGSTGSVSRPVDIAPAAPASSSDGDNNTA